MKPTSKRTPLIVLCGLAVSLLLAALPALAAEITDTPDESTPAAEAVSKTPAEETTEEGAPETESERTRRRVEVLRSNVTDSDERQSAVEARMEERAATQAERQATMEERRQEISANQAERRAALTERAQTRIMNLAANISNRMEAALRRLENISDRMSTRLDQLAERGMSVDAARSQLTIAETEIQSAYQTLADIDTLVSTAVTSENPRQSWETVRTTYASARDDIRGAHQALREVLILAKQAVETNTESAPATTDN